MLYLILAILLAVVTPTKFDEIPVRINQFKNHTLPGCTRLQFNTAYRKIKINIYGQQNIRGILFTDVQLKTDCVSEDLFNECNQQSSFCSYFRQVKEELTYSVGFCSPTVYLYIQNQVDETKEILVGQPPPLKTVNICLQSRYIDSPCSAIAQDKYVQCGSIKPKDCQEKCQFECVYVKCHQKAYERERFGLCLPKNLSKQEYMDRCMMESNITFMNVTSACDKTMQRIVAQGQANPVVTLLIISFIILIISVVYYRYQLRRTGRPPFNPPAICPFWVYPAPPNVIVQ